MNSDIDTRNQGRFFVLFCELKCICHVDLNISLVFERKLGFHISEAQSVVFSLNFRTQMKRLAFLILNTL